MPEAVQPMRPVVFFMPIVQEVIVEKGGADKRTQVQMMPKVKAICDFHAQTGHGDGVLIGGHGAMLQRVPLDLHMLMGENIGTVCVYDGMDSAVTKHAASFIMVCAGVCGELHMRRMCFSNIIGFNAGRRHVRSQTTVSAHASERKGRYD